jgi:hypothetical protein
VRLEYEVSAGDYVNAGELDLEVGKSVPVDVAGDDRVAAAGESPQLPGSGKVLSTDEVELFVVRIFETVGGVD